MVTRLDGWETQLQSVIREHRKHPFSYGNTYNCFFLAMDVAKVLTGEDPYESERTKVKTEAGAYKRLKARGFNTFSEAIAAVYPEVAVSYAKRGDIGIIPLDAGFEAVVVFINTGVIGHLREGMKIFPRELVTKAFRVGW